MLFQLRQFTQLIQEGRLEGATPEMEAEEVPYGADWEGIIIKRKNIFNLGFCSDYMPDLLCRLP